MHSNTILKILTALLAIALRGIWALEWLLILRYILKMTTQMKFLMCVIIIHSSNQKLHNSRLVGVNSFNDLRLC